MTNKEKDAVFAQFALSAEIIIEGGTAELKVNLEAGDWTLFVINRKLLSEEELDDIQQERLKLLDKDLSKIFTPQLLDAYARLEKDVKKWWS